MGTRAAQRRILFLTPQLPYPPWQGRSLRNYNLLRYLALSGRYRVSLLSFADASLRPSHLTHLRTLCHTVETVPEPIRPFSARLHTLVTSSWPDMAWRLASAPMQHALVEQLLREQTDILQVEGIELAPYLWPASAAAPGALLVFDDHNAEYVLQKRAFLTDAHRPQRAIAALYSLVQWLRLRRFERDAARRAGRLIVVSEADARALTALDRRLEPVVVPNGVDLQAYRPGFPALPGIRQPSLVFTGKMDFRPNVDAVLWFSREVLPRLWAHCPEAYFYIVGQSPSPRLDPLRAEPRIVITGEVDDTRPYIAAAGAYVVPLLVGGGTRLKVLETLALGRPLVSTTLGVEGLGISQGKEALLADEPEDFARQILTLLGDADLGRRLGQAARAFVERSYGWQSIGPRLEAAYSIL